jgi:transcriptional regulator with XRE-family HTH domain
MAPGNNLRLLRERLGITLKDVEHASQAIAEAQKEPEYALIASRLSDIETKSVVPSIYRLYSLSVIYRQSYAELLELYGINFSSTGAIPALAKATHPAGTALAGKISVPVRMDPSFDLAKTSNIGRMIEKWGVVPVVALQEFANSDYSYGYIGLEDFTMYPLILPGAFIQIDESRSRVAEQGHWRSEYERPIYFVETRTEFLCCWCTVDGNQITLQPHPLSPAKVRVAKFPQEAEVIGQVVGVAMQLSWTRGAALRQDTPALD